MSYPTDIDDLQHDLKSWTEKQFPSRTTSSICAHLRKETEELEESPSDLMEYADCMMLLLDAASFNGIRASAIVRACGEKLIINQQREWGEPNEQGFVEHVKHDKSNLKAFIASSIGIEKSNHKVSCPNDGYIKTNDGRTFAVTNWQAEIGAGTQSRVVIHADALIEKSETEKQSTIMMRSAYIQNHTEK